MQVVSRHIDVRPITRFLQFEPTALRNGATAGGHANLDSKGYGLGRVLAELILRQSGARENATERLRSIVKGVRDVSAENRSGQFYPVVVFDELGSVPAEGLSEGTLYALGLVVSLDWTEGPKLLLTDDLDKGLHPAAQAEIVSVLCKVQAEDPELQIVATTHSPYLLQEFDHSEVRVMTRGPDGFARCRNLVDHPEYGAWKDALNAGAYWSAVGEDWIVAPPA